MTDCSNSVHLRIGEHYSLPTLFFIKDQEIKYRMEGALPAEQLDELVEYFFFDGPRPGPK